LQGFAICPVDVRDFQAELAALSMPDLTMDFSETKSQTVGGPLLQQGSFGRISMDFQWIEHTRADD
jgi:hypothetical protein